MKIILCIFLPCITAVSVFGQSEELHGILGESVKFPAAVERVGTLRYSGFPIGDVTGGRFRTVPNENFSGRVHWDSSTGLFSLSGLRKNDTGEYKVENTDQNINTVYWLNLYKDNVPVSKPHVSITRNEYPCTILCSVERGTEVTLSWHREGEKKPFVSLVESAPGLHVPQTVEGSGIYTCEAKNSVSNEKASITVGAHCKVSEPQERNGIVGESVKFPAAVKKVGKLMHIGVPIGNVTSGSFSPARNEKFSGRVHWDSSTGLFSLSELKLEDSGEYTVESDGQKSVSFNLIVWEDNVPVLKPHLNVTHNEYRCTVLCAAVRGTGATLTLYREGETNPYVTSPVRSHPDLDMTQTVESGTYTCEAKNSVSSETSDPLTVGAHCTAGPSTGTIVAIVIAVVALVTAGFFAVLYHLVRRNILDIRRKHQDEQAALQDIVRSIKDEQEVLQDNIRTLIQEVRRQSEGNEKPKTEKGCAIS